MSLHALWQQANPKARLASGLRTARGAGFGTTIPAAVRTVRVTFVSATGYRCCLAVPSDLPGRRLVLDKLPVGEAEVTLAGYPSDSAPADGVTNRCVTDPLGVGQACSASFSAPPSYTSDPTQVTISPGVLTEAGEVLIVSTPFFLGLFPEPNASVTSPVAVEFTIVDSNGIREGTITVELDETEIPLSAAEACDDLDTNATPCSEGRTLDVSGFLVSGAPQNAAPGTSSLRVQAANNDARALNFQYPFRVLAPATETATPALPATPTPTPVVRILRESITSTDSFLTLDDAGPLPESGLLRIGDELLSYSGKDGNTLTGVVRGEGGTQPAPHSAGAAVLFVPAEPTPAPSPTATSAPDTPTALPSPTQSLTPTSPPTETLTPTPEATRTAPSPTSMPTETAPPTPSSSPAHTPTREPAPTDTATVLPTASLTATAGSTPTETAALPTATATIPATVTPATVTLRVGSAQSPPENQVAIPLSLSTAGQMVLGTQNVLALPPGDTGVRFSSRVDATEKVVPDCDPGVGVLVAFGFRPSGCSPSTDCTGVMTTVLSTRDPLADGATLYTCRLDVTGEASPGARVPVTCSGAQFVMPDETVLDAACTSGEILVTEMP